MASRVLKTCGLYFKGNSYVRIPSSSASGGSGVNSSLKPDYITLAAWVYVTYNPPTWWGILCKPVDDAAWRSPHIQWKLGKSNISGQPFHFAISIGGTQYRVDSMTSVDSVLYKWTFLFGRFDGAKMEFFINNMLENSLSVSGKIDKYDTDAVVGRSGIRDPNEFFYGIVGMTLAWNRPLTDAEKDDLYNNGQYPKRIPKNGLILCLDFTEYEGDKAYDKSGYGNHGTIYGAEWVVKKAKGVVSI